MPAPKPKAQRARKPDEVPNNKGYNKAHESAQEDAKDFVIAANGQLGKERPLLSEDEQTLSRILGPEDAALTDTWTLQHEAEFQLEWNCSRWRMALDAITDVGQLPYNMHGLWKACVRLHNRSPFELVSPSLFMEGETEAKQHGGVASPLWHRNLCLALHQLCVQPCFCFGANGWKQIPVLLQFAVICRTGDTRPWNFVWHGDSAIVAEFSRAARETSATPMVDRLNGLLQAFANRGSDPSPICHILAGVAKLTKLDGEPDSDGPRPLYRVRAADVKVVMSAIDMCSHAYGMAFRSCQVNYELFQAAMISSLPRGVSLCDWMRRSMMTLLRQKKLSTLPPPRPVSNSVGTQTVLAVRTASPRVRPALLRRPVSISSDGPAEASGHESEAQPQDLQSDFGHDNFMDFDRGNGFEEPNARASPSGLGQDLMTPGFSAGAARDTTWRLVDGENPPRLRLPEGNGKAAASPDAFGASSAAEVSQEIPAPWQTRETAAQAQFEVRVAPARPEALAAPVAAPAASRGPEEDLSLGLSSESGADVFDGELVDDDTRPAYAPYADNDRKRNSVLRVMQPHRFPEPL